MHDMTKANLEAAFAGESQAHMKYLIFAEQAEKDGFPQVARLFRATAYAEQVHATSHFKVMQKVGDTSANLQTGIDGETFEVDEMYPAYQAVAELQEERGAVRSTTWAREAEKVHAVLYADARFADTPATVRRPTTAPSATPRKNFSRFSNRISRQKRQPGSAAFFYSIR
jgi:rubrerythrin